MHHPAVATVGNGVVPPPIHRYAQPMPTRSNPHPATVPTSHKGLTYPFGGAAPASYMFG